MAKYIVRRLAFALITLLGVSLITFILIYAVPADPVSLMAGPYADSRTLASIKHQMGLDRPVSVQYGLFLIHALQGDWGKSFFNQLPVLTQILQRFPATLELALAAFVLQLIIGIPIGILAAVKQNTRWAHILMAGVLIGLSLPGYWLGVMLMFIFALKLSWFPLGGFGSPAHLVLPALTIAITGSAYYARLLRSSMIEVAKLDYVRSAQAKGIRKFRVLIRHIMRNSLIPVVTWAGMDLARFIGGLTIVETVFGWPGIGQLTFQSIQGMDIPLITGVVMFSAVIVVLASLIVDIVYVILDPRISYE